MALWLCEVISFVGILPPQARKGPMVVTERGKQSGELLVWGWQNSTVTVVSDCVGHVGKTPTEPGGVCMCVCYTSQCEEQMPPCFIYENK